MAISPEPAATAEPEAPPPAKKRGVVSSWLPTLLAIVAAPALTWAVCQFVLIPRLKEELAAPLAASADDAAKAGADGEAMSPTSEYAFENMVVNLAGTMGTRYLKTTFLVTGDGDLVGTFEANRVALIDVTINVLSSLSLTDLEEPGSKNLIREKLVQSYNQALGRRVAEQVFFADFVVQ